jgi:predicted metal-dependent phosphoesterase TrpH
MPTLLKADLHIHTKYSMDCRTPLEKIIERCQELNINCIAIADHGTAEGALEMQKLAPPSLKVIVAEEILTTDGEIMGMFLKETIESKVNARLTPVEAVKRIREQGGLVNIPHPFETFRGSALKQKALDEIIQDIDLVEVLNSRSLFPKNSNKARDFAVKHGLPGGAGSDAHVPNQIGKAYIEMDDFNNKEEFLRAVARGKIMGERSGLYVLFISAWTRLRILYFKTRMKLRGRKHERKV